MSTYGPVYAKQEVRMTSSTGGQKSTKFQRPGLIPGDVLLEFSQIYSIGAKKYDDNNWRKGYDWSLSIDAALRHLEQFNAGEDYDLCTCDDEPEGGPAYPCVGCGATGQKHILQCAWHCFTLAWYMDHKREFDNRAVRFDEEQAEIAKYPTEYTDPNAFSRRVLAELRSGFGHKPVNLDETEDPPDRTWVEHEPATRS